MRSDASHYLVITKDGKHLPLCGWSNWNQATADKGTVSCKRCLKKLAQEPKP